MSFKFSSALLLSFGLMYANGHAATTDTSNDPGSVERTIQDGLRGFMPKGMAPGESIQVLKRENAYEVRIKPIEFFGLNKIKGLKLTGLGTWTYLVHPQNDGTWRIEQADGLNVKGSLAAKGKKATFEYTVDSVKTDGLYDPTMRFLMSSRVEANDMRAKWNSETGSGDARFGSMTTQFQTTKADNNTVNISAHSAFTDLLENLKDPKIGNTRFTAASGTVNSEIKGLALQPIREIVTLVYQNLERKTLPLDVQDRLKTLVKSSLPLVETINQSLVYNDVQVETPKGTIGLKTLNYSMNTTGISQDTQISLGMNVNGLKIPSNLLPVTSAKLVPDTVQFKLSLAGVNASDATTYLIDTIDPNKKDMTPPEKAELSRRLFPKGSIKISYDGIRMASPIYDVSVSGNSIVATVGNDKPTVDATIRFKNFDDTVNYLQAHVKEEPNFAQAAFFMLMAKGFAQAEPDGQQVWHVESDAKGAVKINGRDFNLPGK